MRKYFVLSAILLILVILVLLKVSNNPQKENKTNAKPAVPLVNAECYRARDTIINLPLRAVGFIVANEKVDIVSEISRRILSIAYTEGSLVKKGDLLFQLDDADWLASLKKNNAQLDLAKQTEERNKNLLKSGGCSQQLYDETVSQRKVLEAENESLQVLIEKAKIRAPFSGKTGIRNVSPGALVAPAMVLTTLQDINSLKIDFTVPESQANAIKKGDKLNFRLEGSSKEYSALVEATDVSFNTNTGSLRVQARIITTANELLPGLSVSIQMLPQSKNAALFVPTQALIPTSSGYKVYLVQQGKAKLKPVKTGLRSESMVEITDGIQTGDSVLTTGFMKVRPDAALKILKTW